MTNETLYLIAFAMNPSIKEVDKKNWLEQYGSATHLFDASQNDAALQCIQWPLEQAKKEMDFILAHQIQVISILDNNYPSRLKHCPDAPILLYYKGEGNFNKPHLISVVGARKHTIYVNKIVNDLIEGIAHLNIGIISGLAQGVDGLVHQKALEKNIPTWGVLGHGLQQIYPPMHRKLAIQMLSNGGLLTEFYSNTAPLAFHFPKRNRIVAGMSDATLIIESGLQGGSMITASLALQYNREVFAVPGKLYDEKSQGCLDLVKNHIAQLYHGPEHFLNMVNWPPAPTTNQVKQNTTLQMSMDPTQKMILLYIENQGPLYYDNLSTHFKLPPGQLASNLLALELAGMIMKIAGGRYARNLL